MTVARAKVVRRETLRFEHLILDLTETDCGARQWILRTDLGGNGLANGFLDDPEVVARQLDQAAASIREFCSQGFHPAGSYARAAVETGDG